MRVKRGLISLAAVVVVLGIVAFIFKDNLISLVDPIDLDSTEAMDQFTYGYAVPKVDFPKYGEIKDAYLMDTFYYVSDALDKQRSEVYIGKMEDKFYLVAVASDGEQDPATLEKDKLLVSEYSLDEVKDYAGLVGSIAGDFSEVMGQDISSSDFVEGLYRLEEDQSDGRLEVAVVGIPSVFILFAVVLGIVKTATND